MIDQNNIDNLFGLSPLQAGIFLHSLSNSGTGTYFEQYRAQLKGQFEPDIYHKAWEQVVARHDMLRTSFVWEGLPAPYQVVEKGSTLPWMDLDWQNATPEQQSIRLKEFLREDIARGFNLARGPLLRVALIKMDKDEWVAILSVHHIIMDGWSGTIIMSECGHIYEAMTQGKSYELPVAPSYKNYLDWIDQQDQEKAAQYWEKQLSGYASPVVLPMDQNPFKATEDSTGYAQMDQILAQDETKKLQQFAASHGVTVNSVMQAAWGLLLARYNRCDDVVFGTTCATRPDDIPNIEYMVGLLLNTLAIRLKVDKKYSSASWVVYVQEVLVDARAHDYISLADLRSHTDLSQGEPLFETLTVFENYPAAIRNDSSVDNVLQVAITEGFEKTSYPISLMGFPGEQIKLRLLYDANRFSKQAIQDLLSHLTNLLVNFSCFPDKALEQIEMISSREITAIQGWSRGPSIVPYCNGHFLKAVLNRAVEHPQRQAVYAEDGELNYASLLQESAVIADTLKQQGVTKGDIVGLYLNAGYRWPTAVLGVLSTGAIWLPLDPAYPEDRLKYLLEDSGCHLVITEDMPVPGYDGPKIILSQLQANSRAEFKVPEYDPKSPAYLIYTSGSTGTPKGVINSVEGLGNLMTALHNSLKPDVNPIHVLQFASLNFDASVLELVLAFSSGGCLHLSNRSTMADPVVLTELLVTRQISHALLPPTMLCMLDPTELLDFHHVIVGGEACPDDLIEVWSSQRHFYNFYGPTEAAVYTMAACYRDNRDSVGIGKPIANSIAIILDENKKPCPINIPGELYLGGLSLALGYHNRSDLTTARYITLDFFGDDKIRLYQTGDLASWDHSGNIHYLGRLDEQIKIRGYRIEPGEIEHILREITDVSDACVMPLIHQGNSKLLAFIQPTRDKRNELKEKQVDVWRQTYARVYQEINDAPKHPSLNFHGWTTNYTNDNIDEQEMQNWADSTAALLTQFNPSRVLEIGCGQGLLYYRLIAHCDHYTGVDFSEHALDCIRQCSEDWQLAKTVLIESDAISLNLPENCQYDLCILNSVVQYFPDMEYLKHILDNLIPHIAEGGMIFLGDLRNYQTLTEHHAMIRWHQFNNVSGQADDLTGQQYLHDVQTRINTESELLLHPDFATSYASQLTRKAQAVSLYKSGEYDNELSQFRYDSFIFFDANANWEYTIASIPANNFNLVQLEKVLANTDDDIFKLEGLELSPISFVTRLMRLSEQDPAASLQQIAEKCQSQSGDITIGALNRLAKQSGYQCQIVANTQPLSANSVTALFKKEGALGDTHLIDYWRMHLMRVFKEQDLSNQPFQMGQQTAFERAIHHDLKSRLPWHMIPSHIYTLYQWPYTPSGKIDRKKLLAWAEANTFLPQQEDKEQFETDTEKQLSVLFKALLGLKAVARNDDFFSCGGHSILAAQLAFQIRAELWPDFPTNGIYETPDLQSLAARIDARDSSSQTLDLRKDSLLPAHISPNVGYFPQKPEHIFITGATGFVGSHLLSQLLTDTDAHIYCLIREPDAEGAIKRLKANMVLHGLDGELDLSRLSCWPGNLAQQKLGLSSENYNLLIKQCDTLYHCGAQVNFLHSYSSLKAVNVESLKFLLAVLSIGCSKSLHYISTLGIIDHSADHTTVEESSALDSWQGLIGGYNQSKWVADRCARRAQARGLPVSIYRLGSVTGNSKSAICNQNDLLWRMCQAYATLGYYPENHIRLQMTPADAVAKAIVALSQATTAELSVFHLTSDQDIGWDDIITVLQHIGYVIKKTTPHHWAEKAEIQLREEGDDNLSAILPILQNSSGQTNIRALDSRSSHAVMRANDVLISQVSPELLERYLINLLGKGKHYKSNMAVENYL